MTFDPKVGDLIPYYGGSRLRIGRVTSVHKNELHVGYTLYWGTFRPGGPDMFLVDDVHVQRWWDKFCAVVEDADVLTLGSQLGGGEDADV